MVKIYPRGEFEADFPDDGEYDEDGEVVACPGRNAAAVIADHFERVGHKCRGPLEVDQYWGYHVEYLGKYTMWFAVCTFEDGEYYLSAKDHSSLGILSGAKRRYSEYLRELGRAISADPRFRNVRWFSKKDPDHKLPPMSAPVEDE